MAAAVAVAGVALSAIGTGVAVYGQTQAAKQQELFANLNASAQFQQASMSARLATAQASLQAQQQQNQRLAGVAQANALRGEAEQQRKAAQVNMARKMEDDARFRSLIRAKGGKSGTVVDTGSQLDLLLKSTELQAMENAETAYRTDIQRRQLFRQAEGARLGADYASIQSGIELMEGEARASGYRAAGTQAQIQGLAGVSAARGASLAALGGGIGAFGNLGFRAYELQQMGAFRFNRAS